LIRAQYNLVYEDQHLRLYVHKSILRNKASPTTGHP
jgi:hypothetical protein